MWPCPISADQTGGIDATINQSHLYGSTGAYHRMRGASKAGCEGDHEEGSGRHEGRKNLSGDLDDDHEDGPDGRYYCELGYEDDPGPGQDGVQNVSCRN